MSDFNSKKYWESRYKSGGNSGKGSYNNLAEFKAFVINDFCKKNDIESVIEFGCGDGNQIKYFDIRNYIGVDVSTTIINKCRDLYKSDTTKTFLTNADYNGTTAELSLSLDVIYHLIEDKYYDEYMNLLFSASEKYVMIYSTNTNDFIRGNHATHVKDRKFSDWVDTNMPDFKLKYHVPNKYPYNGDYKNSSFCDFYVYSK